MRYILVNLAAGRFGTSAANTYPTVQAYYRHEDPAESSSRSAESYQLKQLKQNHIVKSVDVEVFRDERTGSDDDLVYPSRRHNIYGA